MGFLNAAVHDPMTSSRSRRVAQAPPQLPPQQQVSRQQNYPVRRQQQQQQQLPPAPKYQQQQQQQPQYYQEPQARLPPMYENPAPPAAPNSTNGLLDMWRQKRAAAKTVIPDMKAQPLPVAEFTQPQQPVYMAQPQAPQQVQSPYPKVQPMPTAHDPQPAPPAHAPAPTPASAPPSEPTAYMTSEYLANLRQELINLVTTQAPKQDLEQRLIPINHRFQDFDVRLNTLRTELDKASTSVKSIQMQASSDRRMLLNNISPSDFQALHADLNDALKAWIGQAEETINNVLQEFSDRSFAVYCDAIQTIPILTQPSFLAAADGAVIPQNSRIKVCYPQTQTAEGTFARCVSVNSSGEISLFWIPLHRKHDNQRFVANFTV
jgi:hypothetical protein